MSKATYRALEVVTVFNGRDSYVLRLEEQREGWLEDLREGLLPEQLVCGPDWAVYRFPDHGPSMWVCDCGSQRDVAEFIAKAMPLHDWKADSVHCPACGFEYNPDTSDDCPACGWEK